VSALRHEHPRGRPEQTWGGRPIVRVCAQAAPRHRAKLIGRVVAARALSVAGGWAYEAVLDDGTGRVRLRFLGRRHVDGLVPGTMLEVEGTLIDLHDDLGLINPLYEVVLGPLP